MRRVKHDHVENIAEDYSDTGISGAPASEGSNPFGNKSDIGGDWIFHPICRIRIGILPGHAKMDTSLYLLCCWCCSDWYTFFGGDTGGNDRQSEREDKRYLKA